MTILKVMSCLLVCNRSFNFVMFASKKLPRKDINQMKIYKRRYFRKYREIRKKEDEFGINGARRKGSENNGKRLHPLQDNQININSNGKKSQKSGKVIYSGYLARLSLLPSVHEILQKTQDKASA